ncbi:hypothetical protein BDN72DRAFT_792046 [Pluteus cervinus]|uniref:Uncharacterized protein n=1 Tax=Pluteus cervinus TaxID=181527 RepID=A0ACD3B524_9AGAR|nr:hypothetical protein BDN72DRAFT_792046 [Pluteus cervinus]
MATITEEPEPWCFTVIRANGLRLMRSDKLWRPIISVEVDKHHSHEIVLGTDGQNPNLKQVFRWHQVDGDVDLNSKIDIKVFYRSPSKKKSKHRLVACASHSIGELLKKQDTECVTQIRLQCQSPNSKTPSTNTRGRPQNGAVMLVKLSPPSRFLNPPHQSENEGYSSDTSVSTSKSDASVGIKIDVEPDPSMHEGQVLRQRRRKKVIRGYMSDDQVLTCDESGSEEPSDCDGKSVTDLEPSDTDWDVSFSTLDDPAAIRQLPDGVISLSAEARWIAPSILPTYTEAITLEPTRMSLLQRFVASFTVYNDLRSACLDSQFDSVFQRLKGEWWFSLTVLMGVATVNVAIFAIAPGSLFDVSNYARSAVAASTISSGLGLACDAWFMLRYYNISVELFRERAKDVFDSYFFFSISSRVPAFCMFASSVALMLFLGMVAFDVWPQGVLVTCFLVGLVMTMQFLVYGVHWTATRVVQGSRAAVRKMTATSFIAAKA